MWNEVVISINRKVRVTESNFHFRVETRTFRGWQRLFSTRNRNVAMAGFIAEADLRVVL